MQTNLKIFFALSLLSLFLVSAIPFADASEPSKYFGSTKTIKFQARADAYVNASDPDTNYGGSNLLYVTGSPNDPAQTIIYVKFDLSGLPKNVYIASAKLSLYFIDFNSLYYKTTFEGGIVTGGDFVNAYYCPESSWAESKITWNNAPLIDQESLGTHMVQGPYAKNEYWNWDVTALAQSSKGSEELTIALKFNTKSGASSIETGFAEFYSTNSELGLSVQPNLEVHYATEYYQVQLESSLQSDSMQIYMGSVYIQNQIAAKGNDFPETVFFAPGSYQIEYRIEPWEKKEDVAFFEHWDALNGVKVLDRDSSSSSITVSGNGSLKITGNYAEPFLTETQQGQIIAFVFLAVVLIILAVIVIRKKH